MQPYMGLGNSLQTAQAAAGGGGPGGWVELARTTLGSANADLTVSSLADKRYYMVLTATEGSSANSDMYSRFNGDSGSNYAYRVAYNGTESTQINQGNGGWHTTATGSTTPLFTVAYIANLAGEEKLFMCPLSVKALSGAGSAPERSIGFTKWTNTSAAINSITQTTTTSTTQSTGSEMVVLGWDPADTHTTNFWEELASVNATGSSNDMVGGASSNPSFTNIFIVNNSANEKLAIGHNVDNNGTGATNYPDRIEMVGKWANTSAQITEIDLDSTGSNFSSNSILKVPHHLKSEYGVDIDINDLTAKNFNTILYHVIGVGAGTADTEFRVSSDSGTNYSSRNSGNGGADGTFVSDTGLPQNQYKSYTEFVVTHMCNIDGEEKLFLKWTMEQGDPGAGNITYRRELVGKHATTTGQITDVELY